MHIASHVDHRRKKRSLSRMRTKVWRKTKWIRKFKFMPWAFTWSLVAFYSTDWWIKFRWRTNTMHICAHFQWEQTQRIQNFMFAFNLFIALMKYSMSVELKIIIIIGHCLIDRGSMTTISWLVITFRLRLLRSVRKVARCAVHTHTPQGGSNKFIY